MSDQLQNKLLAYAQEPPAGAWERIAASLDQEAPGTYAQKLHSFEQEPPAGIWNKIEASLGNAPLSAPVIPLHSGRKRLRSLRVAAAVLLLIASVATFLIVGNSKDNASRASKEPVAPSNIRPEAEGSDPKATGTTADRDNRELAYESEPRRVLSGRSTSLKSPRTRRISAAGLFAASFLPRRAEPKATVSYSAPQEKYMVYSDGAGNAFKLPKKLFDFFSCATEEEICRKQMHLLQEKLATTSVTADFTGVLEILNQIKEK